MIKHLKQLNTGKHEQPQMAQNSSCLQDGEHPLQNVTGNSKNQQERFQEENKASH